MIDHKTIEYGKLNGVECEPKTGEIHLTFNDYYLTIHGREHDLNELYNKILYRINMHYGLTTDPANLMLLDENPSSLGTG